MSVSALIDMVGPELALLVGACVTLLFGGSREKGGGHLASPVAFLTIVVAFALALQHGMPSGQEAALGLWITSLTYYARVIGLGVGGLIVLVNWVQSQRHERGEFMAMILFSLLGVLLTASANDWVVLFFAIELVSIPTYVMIALSRDDARACESSVKYFFLGALSAALLAYGFSFLYGASGTTLIHTVGEAGVACNVAAGTAATIGFVLAFCGLAFKVAAVPFHVYAPDVYEGAASPVTGLLGFVPKFAGMLALIKLFVAFNWSLPTGLMWLVWIVAAVTMTTGNVIALLQKNVKRMLAYSSIAHTGYMLIGLLVGPGSAYGNDYMQNGVSATLFYIAVYGVMNLGVFALLASFRSEDHDMETLDDLGGLSSKAPAAALALAICVFSLMGFPPTAGFLGKLYIFAGAFSVSEHNPFHEPMYVLAVIGVVNAAIGAAYYLRIVSAAYMGTQVGEIRPAKGMPVRVGLALCAVAMLWFFARPVDLITRSNAATTVLHNTIQVDSSRVTGGEYVSSVALASEPE